MCFDVIDFPFTIFFPLAVFYIPVSYHVFKTRLKIYEQKGLNQVLQIPPHWLFHLVIKMDWFYGIAVLMGLNLSLVYIKILKKPNHKFTNKHAYIYEYMCIVL